MSFLYNKRFFYLSIIILVSTILIYASSSGITGTTLKNGNGCNCHGALSTGVNVVINGPNTIEPGKTENFTVTITGGPLSAAGINIAASNGILGVRQGLKLINNELTHSAPKNPTAGSVSFEFEYTAPATTGNITLYATANSVNSNGGTSGDQWNHAQNKTVLVTNATDIKDENILSDYKLFQNYPNPFNPSTTIDFVVSKKGLVSLKVFDAIGNEIATLVNQVNEAGSYSVPFNITQLSNEYTSGVYYYQLKTAEFTQTKKMVLLK